ncbi:dihydrofolate reductase family protein [Streptomyces mauvecolor]
MAIRPYVLLSAAVSVDGRLDDTARDRLVLSNQRDLDRVDGERAAADAILVGANTLRKDNSRLVAANSLSRSRRIARGKSEHPLKVTVTASAELDPGLAFWHCGGAKLVFTVDAAFTRARRALGASGSRADPSLLALRAVGLP